MKPSQVTKKNEAQVWDTLYGDDVQKPVRYKFQVGDRVRISKVKRTFEKSYLPNFTEEIFTVYKRMARQVPVYKLKDDAGEILDGTFYEPELQKIIKNDDVYRVEKILRKRKRKGVVEYLFYLHLPSNSSLDKFPHNTLTEYRVSLPQTLNLTGEWEVALTEIHYPHSWNNIQRFRFYVRNEKLHGVWDSLEMLSGHYSSIEDILSKMKELVDNENRYTDDVRFSYDNLSRMVTVHLKNNAEVSLNDMAYMLGFTPEQ
ncbi:unnamed protein product, partial [Porites lobata]